MPIVPATLTHLAAIHRLMQDGYYRYSDMGHEDLPSLINRGLSAVGEDAGQVWGFVGVQMEERPATMPVGAPTRAYLRGVALQRRRQPNLDLAETLAATVRQLPPHPHAVQYLAYGTDFWFNSTLAEIGFQKVEAVQFYQLDRLRTRLAGLPPTPPATARGLTFAPGHPDHLAALAALDAAAFPPLWHFGQRDLFEMLMRCRVQIAWCDGQIVGYSAVCANSRHEGQLARLAVDPAFQSQGVGRGLLADAIRYAAEEFTVMVLNTQTTNTRSQKLYRGFGFRPIGTPISVLAHTVT